MAASVSRIYPVYIGSLGTLVKGYNLFNPSSNQIDCGGGKVSLFTLLIRPKNLSKSRIRFRRASLLYFVGQPNLERYHTNEGHTNLIVILHAQYRTYYKV